MNAQADAEPDSGDGVTRYAYKPSLMSPVFSFALMPDALTWSRGRHSGEIRYDQITRLRMSFRPATMQRGRYQLEIWSSVAPRMPVISATVRSMVEMQPQGPEFRAFVTELHRRITETGHQPRCEAGLFPPVYWIGVTVLGLTALAMAAMIVRALQAGVWAGAAFVLAFLALFLWQGGQFFRLNRPGPYNVAQPPAALLPEA
ncbi:MAG: hypothetical protein KIT85_00715 [Pseudolabrys sp.]|nr:hypothetical protein [Pseudolabrys sp.]